MNMSKWDARSKILKTYIFTVNNIYSLFGDTKSLKWNVYNVDVISVGISDESKSSNPHLTKKMLNWK